MTTQIKQEPEMNMFDQFEFAPQSAAPATKHSNVFDHYAASQVNAINGQWSEDVFFSPEQQFQNTPASAMTISPAELLSTASTVNNCFSDIEHTPLIEATDLTQDASTWAPLFNFEEIIKDEEQFETQQAAVLNSNIAQQHRPIAPYPPASHETVDKSSATPPSFAKALAMEVERKLKRKESVSKPTTRCPANKVDKHGITAYNRKPRQAPLKPVECPENADNATAKRARNTEAARRSRARKMERMSQLEERIQELIQDKEMLESEVERLKRKCGEL